MLKQNLRLSSIFTNKKLEINLSPLNLFPVETFKNVNLLGYKAYKKCGLLAEENCESFGQNMVMLKLACYSGISALLMLNGKTWLMCDEFFPLLIK